MKPITSRRNALVARYRAIARGDEPALLLLDGAHLVAAALAAGVGVRQAVVAAADLGRGDLKALVDGLARKHIEVLTASASVMDALSPLRSPSAIVAIADRPSYDEGRLYAGEAPLVVIACDVQDPGNLGAIVRVAEAGGATGMVAAGTCADPFGWKALRGSMGSALRLPVAVGRHADQTVAQARRRNCRIVGTAPRGGRSVFDIDLRGATAVLVGGEGPGLPQLLIDAADERVTIPMQAPVESLNSAVTAALIVYEARRQRAPREPRRT